MTNNPKFFVAIRDISTGKVLVHLPPHNSNYDTLCGMDGDDPDDSVGTELVSVPKGSKVTCKDCYEMYVATKSLSDSDFDMKSIRD
jgi:hypothetical protein